MRSNSARTLLLLTLFVAPACAAKSPVSSAPDTTHPQLSRSSSKAVRGLRADLERIFGAPIMARGVWGVDIRSLETGERLYQLNSGRLMMPASNMKILTVATAAETLGWDYRYTTTLETAAPLNDGVLDGDLIVRGNGDPSMNSRGGRAEAVLTEWADALRNAGVRAIRGRIVGDDQAFDDDGIGPGWSWDYLEAGYAAPSGALQFNENTVVLTVTPGASPGDPPIVTLPAGTGLTLFSIATTAGAGTEDAIDVRRRIDAPVLEVRGSIAAGAAPVQRTVAVANPTLLFAQSVKDGLTSRGIAVSGEAADADHSLPAVAGTAKAGSTRVLVSTQSPPLREIATVLMKVSQNLYAETFLKTLGAARGGLGTTSGGRKAARTTLTAWGVPGDAYVMSDGSGLSRYNYIAPETLVTVLERMHRDEQHSAAFTATLPIAGKDGTIASRMRRTRAEGNAVAKTGSIANVRSLSGYVRSRDGETLVFSILANDFVIPAATVSWMTDLAVEVLANFTRH